MKTEKTNYQCPLTSAVNIGTVGSYNGFRIEGASDLQFTLLRIYYYAPTGE